MKRFCLIVMLGIGAASGALAQGQPDWGGGPGQGWWQGWGRVMVPDRVMVVAPARVRAGAWVRAGARPQVEWEAAWVAGR